ncbi:MAG TPA: glycosyltransferase 87 family protein [Verrucomicrobiae bacterium]|nr:glycosyltransferase 87 family protein [Verrucomicrobiae bacterium]
MVAAVLLAAAVAHVGLVYEPYTFLIGDCPYYAETAISLAVDRDLDLRNQLGGGVETHARQISLGARGEWYPKHPILMPVLTVPLLPVFGMKSFLVFNVAVLVLLTLVLYALSLRSASPPAAAAGALATLFGSFLFFYDYNYSPDLFACLVLMLSVLALFRDRPASAGVAAGIAVLARTSNLFLLPLLLAFAAWRRRARGATAFALACAAPLLLQGALNAAMFGSPLTSPYSRIITLEGGRIVLHSHMSDFGNPLLDGIRGQLLDRDRGLVFTAPVVLLAIPGLVLWFRRRRDQALLAFGLGEFLFLLFSRYLYWPTSHLGNRFLIPLVALAAPAVACLADAMISRLSPRGARRAAAVS